MNSVERVKAICAERGIAISRLEKELGFSNGYIGQLRKGIFPSDRLDKIASYLNVDRDYLLYGEKQKAPADTGKREPSDEEIYGAFFKGAYSEKKLDKLKKMAALIDDEDDES